VEVWWTNVILLWELLLLLLLLLLILSLFPFPFLGEGLIFSLWFPLVDKDFVRPLNDGNLDNFCLLSYAKLK
jgi:hypothetical protein